jgi:hypothetical protein
MECGEPQFADINRCADGHEAPGVIRQTVDARKIIDPLKHPPLPHEPHEPAPPAPIEAKADLPKVEKKDPIIEQVLVATEAQLRRKARIAIKSGYLPSNIYTEDQVLTIVRAGEELGLPFMSSLRCIYLIEGKIALEATAMRALVFRKIPGARIDFIECSAERCLVEMQRPGGKTNLFAFTIEDARRAGLLAKKNWKYPISMLIARASTIGIKAIFPDAILGGFGLAYEVDEIDDDKVGPLSETDIEIEKLRSEILIVSSSMPDDKRLACLDQTNKAAAKYNIELLQKILLRAKEVVGTAPTQPATPPGTQPTTTSPITKESPLGDSEKENEGTQEVSSVQ